MRRDGACERTIQAHGDGQAVVVLPAERASSAPGRRHREAVDDRRCPRAHLPGGRRVRRGAARRRALCGRSCIPASTGCTTSTGRSSTPSWGTPGRWSVAVTPDGQHIISGSSDKLVNVWSVAARACEHVCGYTDWFSRWRDARRPASSAARSTRPSACLSTAPSRTPSAAHRRVFAVALPDNQHALSASATRPSSSTSTTAPCALHAPHTRGAHPGAAARRPPLRQRLVRHTAASSTTASRRERPLWTNNQPK